MFTTSRVVCEVRHEVGNGIVEEGFAEPATGTGTTGVVTIS